MLSNGRTYGSLLTLFLHCSCGLQLSAVICTQYVVIHRLKGEWGCVRRLMKRRTKTSQYSWSTAANFVTECTARIWNSSCNRLIYCRIIIPTTTIPPLPSQIAQALHYIYMAYHAWMLSALAEAVHRHPLPLRLIEDLQIFLLTGYFNT